MSNGDYYNDSGIANAYILSVIGARQSSAILGDGFSAVFIPSNPNTGASTVNVGGFGLKDIRRPDGSALSSGDLTTLSGIRYDEGAGYFRLLNFIPEATTTNSGRVELATNAETITGADTTRAATSSGVKAHVDSRSGAGSGFDSDFLDGQHGSFYQSASNLNAGIVQAARLSTATTQAVGDNSTKIATTAFVKAQATGSMAASGYYKCNITGLKVQWGKRSCVFTGSATNSAVTFSPTFASIFQVYATLAEITQIATTSVNISTTSITTSGFTIQTYSNNAFSANVSWLAIGT